MCPAVQPRRCRLGEEPRNCGCCGCSCQKTLLFDELDDEEAGGLSVEAGYEKDGKYAKIKWEKDQMDDEEVGMGGRRRIRL